MGECGCWWCWAESSKIEGRLRSCPLDPSAILSFIYFLSYCGQNDCQTVLAFPFVHCIHPFIINYACTTYI